MEREEVRAAASTLSPRSSGSGDWGSTRLPLLCARPGNVGVQIDAYRSMKTMFNRPRCGQFTAHFLGYAFENSSMDNYQRVVERTAQRAQILETKLARLREYEQHLVDDEARRKARRQEREAARQRRRWQHLQSMKRQDQREREADAAVSIQRRARGMAARRSVAAAKCQRAEQHAGDVLQRTLARYTLRCRHHRQVAVAMRDAAATALQRRARSFVRERRSGRASVSALVHDAPDEEVQSVLAAMVDRVVVETEVRTLDTPPLELAPSLTACDVSLELLFSDDEDSPLALSPFTPRPPPSAATDRPAPKRPARARRVGGGFRASLGGASPPRPSAGRRASCDVRRRHTSHASSASSP